MSADRFGLAAPQPELLHAFLNRTVDRYPDAIAIDVPPGRERPQRCRLTYAELHAASDGLAARIAGRLSCPSIVATLLPRSAAALYVAQIAALKAGAAFLCLDPAFPDYQIRSILEDSASVVLLTDAVGARRVGEIGFPQDLCLLVDTPAHCSAQADLCAPVPKRLTADSLAYLIYTSGTTGKPKGVQITHRSIANLIRSDLDEFGLGPGDRVAQGSSAAYDSSVEETWLALASGAALVVMDDDAVRSGPDIVTWLRDERISVFCPPPTLLRATGCDDPQSALPDLRLLYVGGEALPPDVVALWAPGRRLVNGYGPTECTVTALRADIRPGGDIPIGYPVPGVCAYLLDAEMTPVPEGESGELCLGGIQLAAGYLGRQDLTEEKFPVHPTYGRIYRTGDKASRNSEGAFFYEGRLDAQVKLRGYRIELEAIEACLARCEGVREAAATVQSSAETETLVAFIVPNDPNRPPPFASLKAELTRSLPAYMSPAQFALIGELPKTVGGKLKRAALPLVAPHQEATGEGVVAPTNPVEERLCKAFAQILGTTAPVSTDADFFHDLGGNSLQAARLVSLLRSHPATEGLTVRDIYEARSVSALAGRVLPEPKVRSQERARSAPISSTPATIFQGLWLLLELAAGSAAAFGLGMAALPWLLNRIGPVPILICLPLLLVLGMVAYTPLSVLAVVVAKRVLIGAYRPTNAPVWGSFFVRNWIVTQMAHLIPWQLLSGTEFECMALRALGARIGKRVHIHRGVDLMRGGWDLLTLEDDVSLNQESALRLVELLDGRIVVGPITLGRGATLEVRAGVGVGGALKAGACLTALSSLCDGAAIPEGERWDGIPARPAGRAPAAPLPEGDANDLPPMAHGAIMIGASLLLTALLALPFELPTLVWLLFKHLDASQVSSLLFGERGSSELPVLLLLATAPLPLTLILEALIVRGLGRCREGVVSRWSLAYIPIWLKAGLVDSASEWLSGAMFWPAWLRLAGMRVGAGCEISTIIDVIPELVEIGPETFFADGIYLGGPRVDRGSVTLGKVSISRSSFLGNHVVVPGGQSLPEGILLGVCTVANQQQIRQNSSWFGLPPFELPVREVIQADRSVTHAPSPARYISRVFWEYLRFALPAAPALLVLEWLRVSAEVAAVQHGFGLAAAELGVSLAFVLAPCLLILALKWLLLGRVRPGEHPLWSCWCSRWDFLYVAWGVLARAGLTALEGTEFLTWYLRAIGMKIGRGVVLGPGFSQVVDPDMLEFEEYATINAMFQAHTFEDRVLKIDRVYVRRGATLGAATVPLYGADIGEEALVAPHSVIMKRERLLPGILYEGAPTRPASKTEITEEISDDRPRSAVARSETEAVVRTVASQTGTLVGRQ